MKWTKVLHKLDIAVCADRLIYAPDCFRCLSKTPGSRPNKSMESDAMAAHNKTGDFHVIP